ncbi:MAG: calcium-binding protein [Geminicoccaceae bacterium]
MQPIERNGPLDGSTVANETRDPANGTQASERPTDGDSRRNASMRIGAPVTAGFLGVLLAQHQLFAADADGTEPTDGPSGSEPLVGPGFAEEPANEGIQVADINGSAVAVPSAPTPPFAGPGNGSSQPVAGERSAAGDAGNASIGGTPNAVPPSGDGTVFQVSQSAPTLEVSELQLDGLDAGEGALDQEPVVEDVTLDPVVGDGGDDQLVGTDDDDFLLGQDGNDSLFGGEGDDILDGGTGDDVLNGGGGDDDLIGRTGDDVYRIVDSSDIAFDDGPGAGGTDTAIYTQSFADGFPNALTLRFADGIDLYALPAEANPLPWSVSPGIENVGLEDQFDFDVMADDAANTISGNAGANRLYGLAGDDTLGGGGGRDHLYGGGGNDFLRGGHQEDFLYGGEGDDSYEVGLNDIGVDTVFDHEGDNTIAFEGVDLDQIQARMVEDALHFSVDGQDRLIVDDFAGAENQTWIRAGDSFELADTLLGVAGAQTFAQSAAASAEVLPAAAYEADLLADFSSPVQQPAASPPDWLSGFEDDGATLQLTTADQTDAGPTRLVADDGIDQLFAQLPDVSSLGHDLPTAEESATGTRYSNGQGQADELLAS